MIYLEDPLCCFGAFPGCAGAGASADVGCNILWFVDRDEMKLTQQEFTSLPVDLVGLVIGAVGVAMIGRKQILVLQHSFLMWC